MDFILKKLIDALDTSVKQNKRLLESLSSFGLYLYRAKDSIFSTIVIIGILSSILFVFLETAFSEPYVTYHVLITVLFGLLNLGFGAYTRINGNIRETKTEITNLSNTIAYLKGKMEGIDKMIERIDRILDKK